MPIPDFHELTAGCWARFTALAGNQDLIALFLGDGSGGNTRGVARVQMVTDSGTFGPGEIWRDIQWHLRVVYVGDGGIGTSVTFPAPFEDPMLLQPDNAIRSGWPTHRLTLRTRTSTHDPSTPTSVSLGAVFADDGEISFYIDDIELLALTGLTLSAHADVDQNTVAVHFHPGGDIDRCWLAQANYVPTTTTSGGPLGLPPSSFLINDNFDGGDFSRWEQVDFPLGSGNNVYALSDCGADGDYGLSIFSVGPDSPASLVDAGTHVGSGILFETEMIPAPRDVDIPSDTSVPCVCTCGPELPGPTAGGGFGGGGGIPGVSMPGEPGEGRLPATDFSGIMLQCTGGGAVISSPDTGDSEAYT